MSIKKLQNADVENKKVILRVDFNVAVENGKIAEKFKIEAAKESLDYLLSKNAKIALISHFGRPAAVKTLAGKPEGKTNPEFSFKNLSGDIQNILGVKVKFIDDCIGEKVQEELNNLENGEVLLLENVRFYAEDESNDENFAKKLAAGFDIFINDAFSVCHRDQASVTGITQFLPSFAGLRLQKEIEEMEKIKNNFARPAVAIIGGAKIETKLPVIKFFERIYDFVLVGGKIANEAIDQKIYPHTKYDSDKKNNKIKNSDKFGVGVNFSEKVILPWDFVDDRLDIGPETLAKFKEIISSAKTIVWNGPTGKFEEEKYARSTNEILEAVISSGAYTIVGGGETLEVLEKNNAMQKISFVSTGGGAMLEYLTKENLPGIKVLEE